MNTFHSSVTQVSLPRPAPYSPLPTVTARDHLVLVLDGDHTCLRGLKRLLGANGYCVSLHTEPEDFFRVGMPSVPSCLLLDSELGDKMSGVEVFAEIQRRNWNLPTVFVTANWSVQSVVEAMRSGADDFLVKPYNAADLLAAVERALQRSRSQQRHGLEAATARARATTLTHRECEIVRLVAAGSLNKEIADLLNIALITVKIHRSRAMQKLGAGNAAELVRLSALAGLS